MRYGDGAVLWLNVDRKVPGLLPIPFVPTDHLGLFLRNTYLIFFYWRPRGCIPLVDTKYNTVQLIPSRTKF